MQRIPHLIHDGDGWNVAIQSDRWHKLARDLVAALQRPNTFPDEVHSFVSEALAEAGIVPDTIAGDIEANLPEALRPNSVRNALAPVPADVLDGLAKLASAA